MVHAGRPIIATVRYRTSTVPLAATWLKTSSTRSPTLGPSRVSLPGIPTFFGFLPLAGVSSGAHTGIRTRLGTVDGLDRLPARESRCGHRLQLNLLAPSPESSSPRLKTRTAAHTRSAIVIVIRLQTHDPPADARLQFPRRPQGHDTPRIDLGDPIGHLCLCHVMGCEEDRPPLIRQALDLPPEDPSRVHVQTERRLVKEEDLRILHERPGQLEFAPLPPDNCRARRSATSSMPSWARISDARLRAPASERP